MRELIFLSLANNLPSMKVFNKIRYYILKLVSMKIGGKCVIWGPLTIRPIGGIKNIQIGKGTFLNSETRFGVPNEKVIIGDNVQIGPRVMFETVSHSLEYIPGKGRGNSTQSIVVEDEVWIGGGVIITQGVKIGQGVVIAAGSVLIKNIEAKTLVAGAPAKFIRTIGS